MNKYYPDYSVIPTYNKTNKSFKHHEEFNVKIKILNLSMNEITDSSIIEEFKFSLKNSFLLEINFSYNNLGDASVRNFASGLSESHIKKINMTQTNRIHLPLADIDSYSKFLNIYLSLTFHLSISFLIHQVNFYPMLFLEDVCT